MSNIGSEKPICGVKCIVENCVHHTTSNGCTAGSITVGGHDATAVKETGCETFAKRECRACSCN